MSPAELHELELKAQKQQLSYALNALKRIATGEEVDPIKFAEITLKHIMGPQEAIAYINKATR